MSDDLDFEAVSSRTLIVVFRLVMFPPPWSTQVSLTKLHSIIGALNTKRPPYAIENTMRM